MGNGYFADGYWADNYFSSGYWGGTGTSTPSTPIVGDKWAGRAVLKKKPSLALLLAAKRFFEAELGE